MNNLIRSALHHPARIEFWENDQFTRRCADFDPGDPALYEFIADAHARPMALVIQWRLPVTVRSFTIGYAAFKSRDYTPVPAATVLEYWDGGRWRGIRAQPVRDDADAACDARYRRCGIVRWIYNFPATTTCQLRFRLETPARVAPCIIRDVACYDAPLAVRKGSGVGRADRFTGRRLRQMVSAAEQRAIDRSGPDRLGRRLLAGGGEPTYASVAAPLYPLDFGKSAIGRIDEGNETLVTWNGTLIMVEGVEGADWDHYSAKSMAAAWKASARRGQLALVMAGFEQWVDRWFAFAVGRDGELVGTDLRRTTQGWLDGYKPGMRTTYRRGALTYTFTAFVEPEARTPYLNRVSVEIANHSRRAQATAVGVILGRHASEAIHETSQNANGPRFDTFQNPMYFAPHPTGYGLDKSGRTVRNQAGDVILASSRRGRFGGTARERVFTIPLTIAPGGKQTLTLAMPGVAKPCRNVALAGNPERQLVSFRDYWSRALTRGLVLATPEERVNHCHRNAIAQILVSLLNRGKLKYGSYWYEEYYGPEESEAVTALAKYGYAREARRALGIMLSEELLDPNGYHHQYRHGVVAQTVAEVYALDGDTAWLEMVAPRVEAVGEWIVAATSGTTGRYAGLLPKRTYGGDIATPARNLSTNARCWRGLRDAGLLMAELGRQRQADRFLDRAAHYRQRILKLVRDLADRTCRPPFVPMGLDIGRAGEADYRAAEPAYPSLSQEKMGAYWHIFAAWMLRSGILDPAGLEARWITDTIEQRGGLLLGLLRLGKMHAAANVDLDTHYGLGYIQTLLARGERARFLLSFYGLLAHGMSRTTFSSPESSCAFPLRADPDSWNRMMADTRWEWGVNSHYGLTEPLSSGASVTLLSLLRDLLVHEDQDGSRAILHLFTGLPADWLAPGRELVVQRAPTRYGRLDVGVRVQSDGVARIRLAARWRTPPDEIRLHLHPPARRRIKAVRLNSQPVPTSGANEIRLRAEAQPVEVEVRFE